MSAKQLDVQIMGQSYLLGCPAGGEAGLLAAVSKVDEAMCKIRDAGKIKARDKIAVLAALNLAFETPEPAQIVPDAPKSADTPETSHEKLGQLLQRLDHVLKQDGQLI
jgi:cell division protein ZapA